MNLFIELSPDKETELYMHISFGKAAMTAMIDQPEETIAATKEVLSLNESRPGILELEQVEETKCFQGKHMPRWENGRKQKRFTKHYIIRMCNGEGVMDWS